MSTAKVVAFDLEGPLSPFDHAFEVMAREIPEGKKAFQVISRYDDLLTLERREDYEPGDTLALIIPFLLYFQVGEEELHRVSQEAGLVAGAKELVDQLRGEWQLYIVSTSYRPHALNIAQQLGIPPENVYSSRFPAGQPLTERERQLIREAWDYLREHLYAEDLESGAKDREIKDYLDRFFWEELAQTSLASLLSDRTLIMGGRKKVRAVEEISRRHQTFLREMVVVGDSITDFRMLQVAEAAGGLALVFNGNEYALPYGTVGVASRSLYDLLPLLKSWLRGGRKEVKEFVEQKAPAPPPYYHWLPGREQEEWDEVVAVHKKLRRTVRGEAGILG
ncbi:MAG TPA: hypothetical protein EYP85_07215 [Armatimonadetes bacterium]|nr:hypothetical protein [Armatimonadota bacterium]